MNTTKAPERTGANDLSADKVYTDTKGTASGALTQPIAGDEPVATLPDPPAAANELNNCATPISDEAESLRDALVKMAIDAGCKLFRDNNMNTFVSLSCNGHTEHWRLRSDGFRRWLRHQWLKTTRKGLGASVIGDVIDTLDAMAAFGDDVSDVHIRIAHHAEEIYVDLCDPDWRVVRINAHGWSIISEPPVRFIRTKGMLPLPTPESGGSINELRPFINAPSDEIWCLLVAWILSAFSKGPFPVLVLTGEQGSSKSFLCRVLRQLIDPSEVEVTAAPKEVRDLIIAATNSFVVALDNISTIRQWLSDFLCSTSTGAAYRERKYHTNNGEEELFKAKRPIVLNGIDFAMKDDLLSRSFLLTLPVINEQHRQDEGALWAGIDKAMPCILGGVFDTLSAILRNLPNTKLAVKPRMADAALWVSAAEPALGWGAGQFMQIYANNRNQSVEVALESDSFGVALRDHLITKSDGRWNVTWKELLLTLTAGRTPADWPDNSKALAITLTRLSPALRHVGISWSHQRDGSGKRYYEFRHDAANVADVTKAQPACDSADGFPPTRDVQRGEIGE